ncbi:hypothetical protein LPJ78_004879 [Coemansia sp. RSA 989]|nr:velvet factor-domain-containing protein [Coemansia mojavensis]KAJ1862211.1 hypothetical protein LPJ78_004879 [Coemansia sp. RSA 989]KAJ2646218.1 hypothetical protein IWW40_005587 [Coemansia sp. RSA 1250]KAJ2669735.1 hypothetical protein IWW42_004417 [Coemansia sp. RSA 1085]
MTNYSEGSGKHENEPSAYKPADNPLPRYVVSDIREGGSSENSQYSGQGRDSSLTGGMAAMSSPSAQERSSVIEIIHMAQRVDPRTLPPPDLFLQQFHPQLRSFQFKIVQQPIRARMCGSSDKDWRPLSPPAVIKLELFDMEGNRVIENSFMQHLVVHTTLWNENKEEELTVVELPHNSNSKRISAAAKSRKRGVTQFGQLKVEPGLEIENNLLGDHAATSMVVEDERGERGCFFVFPNLSIRLEGRYRLRFMLIKLPSMSDPQPMMVPKCLSTVFSDAFDVYSIKTFPGMIESTPLSRALAQQGLKIPIRNTQDSS